MSRAGRPAATYLVDVVFGVLLLAAFSYGLWTTRDYYFFIDDWLLVRQGGSLGGMVDQYNSHLSIVILLIYRVMVEAFGFRFAPIQVVGMLCFFSIPATYYLTTRRHLGPVLAAVSGLSLLSGRGISFGAAELNHALALVGGIGCAAALNRGRRADPWLAAALALSLASAGGGVAVAVGCVVHNVCVRPPVRRWVSVLGPSALWVCWWFVESREHSTGLTTSADHATTFVWDLTVASFESLGLRSAALGRVLMGAFFVYGLWVVRRGLREGANWLAWTAALVFWGLGLAYSRGFLAAPLAFRYQLPAIGFILLAVVPRSPLALSDRLARGVDRRWVVLLAAGVLAVGALRAPALERDLSESSLRLSRASTINRGRVVVLGLEPAVVPDDLQLPLVMGGLTARDVRSLLDRYGPPAPRDPDQSLVTLGVARTLRVGDQGDLGCDRLAEPFLQPAATAAEPLYLWSPDTTIDVDLRRFGDAWVRLDEARPGEVLRLFLPRLESDTPWEVRAVGACRGQNG